MLQLETVQQHLFVALQIISNAEYGQCVMYVTSLGIVRSTKARCSSVRKILRNLSVRVYERDVFMSDTHCLDLKQRLGGAADISLPQVFIHGHLLGVGSSRAIKVSTRFWEILTIFREGPDCGLIALSHLRIYYDWAF